MDNQTVNRQKLQELEKHKREVEQEEQQLKSGIEKLDGKFVTATLTWLASQTWCNEYGHGKHKIGEFRSDTKLKNQRHLIRPGVLREMYDEYNNQSCGNDTCDESSVVVVFVVQCTCGTEMKIERSVNLLEMVRGIVSYIP